MQALTLACVLTDDEVRARPALLEWAESVTEGTPTSAFDLFDSGVSLVLADGLDRSLLVIREPTSLPPSDDAMRRARATAFITALFDDGAIVGVGADGAGDLQAEDGAPSSVWVPSLGSVGLARAHAWAGVSEAFGAVLSVSLLRVYDTGERVTADVSEAEAEALFLEKVRQQHNLAEPPDRAQWGLSFPLLETEQSSTVTFVGRPDPLPVLESFEQDLVYFMSMSDRDAPLVKR